MMKKKILVLPFIIILAVALTGCNQGAKKTTNQTTTGTAYVGGNEGLTLSFLPNAPPKEVYDLPEEGSGSPFDIGLKIENKGEYKVLGEKYQVTITGIDPESFSKSTTEFKNVKSTPGQTAEDLGETRRSAGETIPGTFTIITIPALTYKYPVSGQIGPFNLRATLCYEYQTEASSNICVLEDLLGTTRREGICKPTESRIPENSGAPVKIQNLEQSVTGKESTAFTFVIKHIGGEKNLVFQNEAQTCLVGDMTKQNKVGVTVELGTKDITSKCSGITNRMTTLYGEQGAQIRCTISTAAGGDLTKGDYTQPVKITLKYDYLTYIDQEITVKQVGT